MSTPPIRVFLDLSGGAIHEVISTAPVEVLIIDDDLETLSDDTPRLELKHGARAGYFRYRLTEQADAQTGFFGVDAARTDEMFQCADEAALDGDADGELSSEGE